MPKWKEIRYVFIEADKGDKAHTKKESHELVPKKKICGDPPTHYEPDLKGLKEKSNIRQIETYRGFTKSYISLTFFSHEQARKLTHELSTKSFLSVRQVGQHIVGISSVDCASLASLFSILKEIGEFLPDELKRVIFCDFNLDTKEKAERHLKESLVAVELDFASIFSSNLEELDVPKGKAVLSSPASSPSVSANAKNKALNGGSRAQSKSSLSP